MAGDRSFKIGGPREHVVLAALAIKANRVTSMEQLIDAVWAEDPPSTARGQIQGCISGLRKLFAGAGLPEAIERRSTGYLLKLSDDDLDSDRFTKLVAVAHRQTSDRQVADAAATLRAALSLWHGRALDGVQSEFVQRGAALLEDARLSAIEQRVRLDLQLGRHEEITGEVRALIAEHPLRERLYGFLMLALYRSGRQAEALEVARGARATLAAEVGIEPCQELQDLERAVLHRDPSLDLPTGGGGSLGPAGRPAVSPRQLPTSIADFIGRQDQIAQIRRILTDGRVAADAPYAVPIVALSGRSGVGKSTLALRVAHELGEAYPDGQLYVGLHGPAAEDMSAELLARFLRALGVSVIPDDHTERAEMYRSRLANLRLLVVLDDVTSEEQVTPLLPGTPTCAVIVTSRTRLYLSGAHWVDVEAFDNDTSMELLARIVGQQRLQSEPDAAAELVRYCGGLPLALRIAGARLASRPHWRVADLSRRLKNEVRRLDELSHRGLELRTSIGLTYRSLPDVAKRLFRLLGLIEAPDFPAWTAAALLDTELAPAEEVLERLVDARMLDTVQGPGGSVRYRFHSLIRGYARERVMELESDAERRGAIARVLGGWLALAERAHRKEYGGDYTILHGTAARPTAGWVSDELVGHPITWFEHERVALVSAVRQAAANGLDELCWDLALTSASLFEVKGYLDDWRETAELANAASTEAGNRTGRAATLFSLGTLHMIQKRLDEAERLLAEALEIFTADGNVHGEALVLRDSAMVDRLQGNFETMLAKYRSALVKMRAAGDVVGEANVLRSLAKFRLDEGDVEEAGTMLAEAMALCRGVRYLRGEAQVASRFAELYLRTGQAVLARTTLQGVLRTVREIGDRIGEAHALYGLGTVRRREGRLDSAETTLVHALSVAEQIGERLIEGQTHYALGELAVLRADNASAAAHLGHARRLFGELGSSLWMAKTLILLSEVQEDGDLATIAGHIEEAGRLLSRMESKEAARLRRQLQEMSAALPAAPRPDPAPSDTA
jgi:DNA-binding SARP family transcriptional activator/tetratricopeptide (TPR) repeat protein